MYIENGKRIKNKETGEIWKVIGRNSIGILIQIGIPETSSYNAKCYGESYLKDEFVIL